MRGVPTAEVFRLKIDTNGAEENVQALTASLEQCQAAAERTGVRLGQLRKMTWALIRADSGASAAVRDMRASLAGLESSLASAFAPIASVVGPLLADLCDMLATAASYVAMFFAILGGKSTYKRVVAGQNAFTRSVKGSSAAAKKLVQNLSGLDELHLWDSGSGGRGGGGGGSGGSGDGIEFEDVEIPASVLDWAQQIRDAINAGDWYAVGELLAEKLNAVIDAWDAEAWGQRLGEKLNAGIGTLYGFMSHFSFRDLAGKLAELLNGALEAVDFSDVGGLFTRFHTAVIDAAVGFFEGLDWGLVSGKICSFFSGAFGEVTAWLQDYDWSGLGSALWQKIKDAIAGIDYGGLASSLYTALGTAIRSAARLLGGFFGSIAGDVKAWWDEDIRGENWADTAGDLLSAIGQGFQGAGRWAKDNLLQPVMDGIRAAFGAGVGSDPDLTAAGGSIGEGILNGIAGRFADIGGWVKEHILDKIREALRAAGWVGSLLDGIFGEETPEVEVTARATGLVDAVPEEQKTLEASASIIGARDNVPPEEKTVEVLGIYSATDQSRLLGVDREIKAKAVYTSSSGAKLKQSWRDITARACYYSATGAALKQSYRDLTARAVYTSASWNRFPKAARDINAVAHYTSGNASDLPYASRVINTVAKFTSVDKSAVDGRYSLTAKAVLKAGGGVFTAGGWKPVQSFAGGGSPRSGRLFIANENGMPELIGRIGAHTAVMNNGQIVSSVAAGVYQAVAAAMGQVRGFFGGMVRQLADIPPELALLVNGPAAMPMPALASGTVLPPRAVYAESERESMRETVRQLLDILGGPGRPPAAGGAAEQPINVNVKVDAQVDRKNLFSAVVAESRVQRRTIGRDPFAG